MAFSDVATVGFVFRNGQKVSNGDAGRIPVLAGQAVNAIKAGAESGKAIFSTPCQAIINTTSEVAKADPLFNGLLKGVNFASKYVNPLITVSSGLKVALAKKEDRQKTLITEAGCLLGMFGAEGWMKKNLVGILDKLPISAKWKPIVKGLTFIAGSIGFSTLGSKIGEWVADKVNIPFGKEERAAYYAKQEAKEAQKVNKPLDYQA
ncbi:MAG: hypothetical protein NC191_06200 [Muribaculaceae bacterium]|nr:hypothetical protein [Muribaculaceae bacterium]